MRKILILLIFVIIINYARIVSSIYSNIGSLYLKDLLFKETNTVYGKYPFELKEYNNFVLKRIYETYYKSYLIYKQNNNAIWGLGRIELLRKKYNSASYYLYKIQNLLDTNKFVLLDSIEAFGLADSQNIEDQEISDRNINVSKNDFINFNNSFYDLNLIFTNTNFNYLRFSDSFIYVLMENVDRYLGTNEDNKTELFLKNILIIQPNNLFANYQLYSLNIRKYNLNNLDNYKDNIIHFSNESIDISENRLLEYSTNIVITLLKDELWNIETTKKVVSYWVWKNPEFPAVENLLKSLIYTYPNDSEWYDLLGKLYLSKNELDNSERYLLTTLKIDPTVYDAYFYLGFIYRLRSDLIKSSTYFTYYYQIAQDDTMAKYEYYKIRKDLGDLVATNQFNHLYSNEQETTLLSNILNNQINTNDLIEIKSISNLEDWHWADWWVGNNNFNSGLSFGGIDYNIIPGEQALRINGFWHNNSPNHDVSRSGFISDNVILNNYSFYILSFIYRTEFSSGIQNEIYSYTDKKDPLFKVELSSTSGVWRKVTIIFTGNESTPTNCKLLFRNFLNGNLWIKDVKLLEYKSRFLLTNGFKVIHFIE
jgi:hypothetical protein